MMAALRSALLCGILAGSIPAQAEQPPLRSPEYRIAREAWREAQDKIAYDPAWKSWASAREKALQAWIGDQPDNAAWIAGSQQDWFSVQTGNHQSWQATEPIPVEDLSANTTRTRRGAWVSYHRAYNLDRIREAARLSRLIGNKRLAEWAADQMDFYADNYLKWPLQKWNGPARMMGQSLDEATSCVALVDSVRLLRDGISPMRVARWQRQLFAPMAENLEQAYQGDNNISLWTRVGMALIALEFDDAALLSRAMDGNRGIRQLLVRNLSADGFWKEGSLSYQAYVVQALTPLLLYPALKQHDGIAAEIAPKVSAMLLSPAALRFHDGTLPAIGDARAGTPAIDRGLFEHVRRVISTPIGDIEASIRKSWDTLLDPPASASRPGYLSPVVSRDFPSLRAALLKDGDWQVFLHYGQATGFHAQAEALNAEIVHAGQYLLRDPGTVAYGSDLHQNFYRTAAAHAIPLIDGIGQEGWAPGELERMTSTSVTAAQPDYNRLAVARRRISLLNGELIDEQSLHAKDRQTHRLGFIISTPCTVELAEANPLLRPASPRLPASPGFAYWQPSAAWNNEKALKASFKCDEQSYAVSFSLPGSYRVVQAQVPDTRPGGRRTALYFETEGRDAMLSSRFAPLAAQGGKE